MAKCIKYKSNDVILRMSDDDALSIVIAGVASYTSKGSWKAYIGEEGRKQHQQNASARKALLKDTEVKKDWSKAAARKAKRVIKRREAFEWLSQQRRAA